MYAEKPLLNARSMLKGFLAGGMFAGFFVLEADIFLKIIVFIYGIFVIADDLLPSREEEDYPLLSLIALVVGFIAGLLATSFSGIYTLLIIIIASIIYGPGIVDKVRGRMVTRF